MRETCARVLAAALMTGAIAAVVAMSALLNTQRDDGYALTAPPSSLQRSVRVPALAAPPRPARAERLVTAHSVKKPTSRPVVARHEPSRGAVQVPRSNPKPASAGRSAPKPPAPEPRELAVAPPPQEVQPPAQAASPQPPAGGEPDRGKGKSKDRGNGKANGHDKGQESDAAQSAASAPPAEAAQPASASESQDQPEAEKDHGHGKGDGHGHGQGEQQD